MSKSEYRINQTEDQRWGIYRGDRLLATVGNYQACESIWKHLQRESSQQESVQSTFSYRRAINRNLIVGLTKTMG